MVCLWGHVAVHSRDTGTIDGDYDDLADELDQDVAFWQVVESEGWLVSDSENLTITVPEWQARFYTGTASERGKKYRETKAQMENERSPNTRRTETNTHEHIDRIEKRREEKNIKEDRREEGDLSSNLILFKKNLQAAGVVVGTLHPKVLDALNNGEAATMIEAARQLPFTHFMGGPSPSTPNNFKNLKWVHEVASGMHSKGGPAPQRAPADPATVKSTVTWCDGKRMTRAEEEAAKVHPNTKHLWEAYQEKSSRNLNRDNHRGDTPSADAPLPQAIPRPVLKSADEDFDTEGAKEAALKLLAAHVNK